jgi:hypothetical protein
MTNNDWLYEYRQLIQEIDNLQTRCGNKQSRAVWTGVKARMRRISNELVREGALERREALPTVWSAFEERMSSDDPPPEEDYIQKVDEAMWDYMMSSPPEMESEWAYWMEIAFARGRSFTREEGIEQQEQFITDEGGYEAVYGQPRPRPQLRMIEGGKSKRRGAK